jgi:hypothetical protein
MSFMYLEIWTKAESGVSCKVSAKVLKDSNWKHGLGTDIYRLSHQPIAIFAIDSFDGLENIDSDELWTELFRRMTTKELAKKFGITLTFDELLAELKLRNRGR